MAKSKKKKVVYEEKITLSKEQQEAFDLVNNTLYNIFIQGPAGCGKSTLINYMKRHLKKSYIICSPTAIAASNVGGMTLHAFFKLPVTDIISEENLFRTNRKKVNEILQNVEVLIIDEVSMVRPDILDAVNVLCQNAKHNKTRAFGGIQVVLVGDLYQLPPVIKQNTLEIFKEMYDTNDPYFFDSDAYKTGKFKKLELNCIYRQENDELLNNLTNLRLNKNVSKSLTYFNSCKINDKNSLDTAVVITPYRATAEQINLEKLNQLSGKEYKFKAILSGSYLKAKSFPVEKELILKEGALVIFTKNNQPEWINGTMGIISDISDSLITVMLLDTGKPVFVKREIWEDHEYETSEYIDSETGKAKKYITEKTIGEFKQFPLQLGYACTIHKAQGKTLDKVIIDCGKGMFAHGQLYVALSRTRNKNDMHITSELKVKDSIISKRVLEFISN